MRKIYITLFVVAAHVLLFGQNNQLVGQYFQNMPAYSPALTGMNDYLDITFGYRKQWAGFAGSPQNNYLSAYTSLYAKKDEAKVGTHDDSVRNDPSTQPLFLKHGVGGYIMTNKQGAYNQTEVAVNYAIHVPVFRNTYLALGVSPSLHTVKLDLSELNVKNSGDGAYQSLLQNGSSYSYLQLNAAVALYAVNYYASMGIVQAAKKIVSGNETMDDEAAFQRQQFIAAYRFALKNNIELIPNTFVRVDKSRPDLIEIGLRARYAQKYWIGATYRNDNTLIGMFGLLIKDKIRFGYAYEYKAFNIAGVTGGTHEIVVGLRLNNVSNFPSMW
jgi:type IX secretion system PorP/SprF family membrane protein